jgi:hypothetical protein
MAMKKKERLADFEIDKLTNSIENLRTRETFDTEIVQLRTKDIKLIKKTDWLFDWKLEIKDKSKEVFKLSTVTLGAMQLKGQRMYLDDKAAQRLIYQYFKT